MRTSPEDQAAEYSRQYRNHVVTKIRNEWGSSVPADASDDEVLDVWRELNVPKDATQEDINDVMDEVYGKDFVRTPLADRRTFGEKAGDVASAVAPSAMSIGANVASSVAPALAAKYLPKIGAGLAKLGHVAGASVPAQLGMAGYYGTQLAGEGIAGQSLEKTAAGIPEPNIADLRAKGYSEQAIRNIVKGYVDTQQSLMGDVQEMGERGVGTAAEAIGNAAVLPVGLGAVENVAANLMGKAAAKAGVKEAVGTIAGKAVARGIGGGVIGGGFGGVDSVIHRADQAVQANEGADTILGKMSKGLLGPESTLGIAGEIAAQPTVMAGAFGKGFKETAGWGALFGGSIGLAEGAGLAGKGWSANRKARATEAVNNARLVSVEKFGDDFRAEEVLDRFKDDVDAGVAEGKTNVQIATDIVSKLHPDVAATDAGMKTIAKIATKLDPWRAWYEQHVVPNIERPLLPTRQGIGSDESVEAGQNFGDYLQEGDFRPDTALPGPRPEGFDPNRIKQGFPGLPPEQMPLDPRQPQVVDPRQGLEGTLLFQPNPAEQPLGLEGGAAKPMLSEGQARPVYPEPGPDQRLAAPGPVQAAPAEGLVQPQPNPASFVRPEMEGPPGALPPAIQPPPMELAPRYEAPVRPHAPEPVAAPVAAAAEGAPATPRPEPSQRQVDNAVDAIRALGDKVEGANVRVGYSTERPRTITIDKIASEEPGSGQGTAALKKILDIADEHGVAVDLIARPTEALKGGRIPVEKLRAWYEKHGFNAVKEGDGEVHMVRDAPPTPETLGVHQTEVVEKLDKISLAAQKRLASRKGRLNAGLDPADIRDHALVLAADMFSRRLRNKAAIETWAVEKWGETIRPHLDKIVEAAQKHFVRMFKAAPTAEKNLDTLLALKDSGAYGAGWYEKTSTWAKDTFGDDADMMLRFLAVTSANGQTESGAAMALKAFAQWKAGMPFEGFRGDSMVGQLNRIAKGENLGPHTKIQNFYDALKGDPNAIVLDRWMIDALNLKEKGGALRENDYRIYAQVIDDLAEMNGMTPRQFQAAVWEGARVRKAHVSEKTGGRALTTKSGSARPLEELVNRKLAGMTIDQYIEASHGNLKQMERLYQGLAPLRKGESATPHTFNPATWETLSPDSHKHVVASEIVPKKELYPATILKLTRQLKVFQGENQAIRVTPKGDAFEVSVVADSPAKAVAKKKKR